MMPKDRQDRIDAKMEELLGGFTIFQGRAKAVIKVEETHPPQKKTTTINLNPRTTNSQKTLKPDR